MRIPKSAGGGRLRALLVVPLTLLALAVPASTAMAGSDTIYYGWIGGTLQFGPQHSLTSEWITWNAGSASCGQAWQPSGGYWVGSAFCAGSSDTNVGHGYCGCELRQGAGWQGGSSGQNSHGYWRQFW